MFWWEDDPEERTRLGEVERAVVSRLAGLAESGEELDWLRRMRVWARPAHPEVLTTGLDSAETIAILDSSYDLLEEISSSYEHISSMFMGEQALVTPASGFVEMLRRQALKVRNVLEGLMPAVDLLYRDFGGRGRLWKGLREAFDVAESDPASSAVARGFEYACVLCHVLDASKGYAQGEASQMIDNPSSEFTWSHLVWQEILRSQYAVERETPVESMKWARLGVAGLSYVDVAERLKCVTEQPSCAERPAPTDTEGWRFVARGPQRIWVDYYLVVEADVRLTDWLGASGYTLAGKEGLEVWPERVYLDELARMVGSLDGEGSDSDGALFAEWNQLVHAPRVIVGDCVILLPVDVVFSNGLPSIGVFQGTLRAGRILLNAE